MTTVDTSNPASGTLLDSYPAHGDGDVERLLAAADATQKQWRWTTVEERTGALQRLASLLRDEVDEHAALISREMGKPVAEARAEVLKCATTCEYYADRLAGFLAPTPVATEAAKSFVAYEPLGCVLAIMPWNFPYWQVVRFAAPALGAGNAGILKHAPNVTGCAVALEDLFRRAGFPEHLLTALILEGHDQVPALIADPRIAAVTLTGSERAGAAVAAEAGRALKKSVLELGGSDPFVVLADADLDAAAPAAVRARFVNAGQSCLCAKRIVVEEPLLADFIARVTPIVESLVVGDPENEGTQVGPLAQERFVDEIDRQVQDSVAMGAKVLVGGHRIDGPGNFYAPTLLVDVTPEMPAFREETFGPVMVVVGARDTEHAVALADDSAYGLAASIWTARTEAAIELGRRIQSGALFVNSVVASDPRMPFGGVKSSGYGRELSVEGLREFTNARTIWATEPSA